MEWYNLSEKNNISLKFASQGHLQSQQKTKNSNTTGLRKGGIIKQGEWAWLAQKNHLQILSLESQQNISEYDFGEVLEDLSINYVEEIHYRDKNIYLVVCLNKLQIDGSNFADGDINKSILALYSIEQGMIVYSILLDTQVTCMRYVQQTANIPTLRHFDGCLAIGDFAGNVILLNLNIQHSLVRVNENPSQPEPCRILDFNVPLSTLYEDLKYCKREALHCALQLESK